MALDQRDLSAAPPQDSLPGSVEEGDALVLSGRRVTREMLLSLHERFVVFHPEQASRLAILDMEHCSMDESCAEPLVRFVNRLRGLSVLNLTGNSLGTGGVSLIMGRLTAPLKFLLLGENEVGDGAAHAIVSYLCYSRSVLHTIDLSHNTLGDTFALLLTKHMRRVNTQVIKLQYNDITTDGARALAGTLCGADAETLSVQMVDLRMNFVDPETVLPSTPPPIPTVTLGTGAAKTLGAVPTLREKTEADPETETVDSMDYNRADLRRRMALRMKAIEAGTQRQQQVPPGFTQRMQSLHDISQRLRVAKLEKEKEKEHVKEKERAKENDSARERQRPSASQLIEELKARMGLSTRL